MCYPLKFYPLLKKTIWGKEIWEISTHVNGLSVISNGLLKGKCLKDVVLRHKKQILGTGFSEENQFPILLKKIHAKDKLSVQVHPDDFFAYNMEGEGRGKNEFWYILKADPGAKLICGLNTGVDKDRLLRAIDEDDFEGVFNYISVKPSDLVYIPSGTVHAIGGGIELLEVQQTSDLTYRLYDYHRKDKNGNERELNLTKAFKVIDFKNNHAGKCNGIKKQLSPRLQCTYFDINKDFSVELYEGKGQIVENTNKKSFVIYNILEGEGEIIYNFNVMKLKKGDAILVPASLEKHIIRGELKCFKTYIKTV